MEQEQEFRLLLQEELVRRCKHNPRYSIRSFAKSLDVDQSTLAKILSGKRKIGNRAIQTLAIKLNLSEDIVEKYLQPTAKPLERATEEYKQITADLFNILSEWHHMAILELLTVESFKPDAKYIARALGLPLQEAKLAIDRLVRVKMLEVKNDGSWVDNSSGRTTNISPQMSTVSLRQLQKQFLQKAIAALDEVDVSQRDQTSMTMAIDRAKLPEAREQIKNFRRSLARFLCRGEKRDDVYNLTIALYPLTQFERK